MADEESEDDSDVEIVEEKGWLSRLKRDDLFPVAEEILSGRKFKCPGVVPLRKFLLDIITRPAREYFDESSEYRTAFGEIVKMCNAGWDNDCQRAKAWIKSYVAEMLSVLLVLRQLADGEKKAASGSGRTITGLSNKDNAYTAIVEHAEEEEDSQDISAMCISHAGREGN